MTVSPQNTPLSSSASERGPERQVHDLVVWPTHWQCINDGLQTVLIWPSSRIRVGDVLILREADPETAWDTVMKAVPGRVCQRQVTHVICGGRTGLAEGYVALSLAEETPIPSHSPCVICGYARTAHGTGTLGVCQWFDGGQP